MSAAAPPKERLVSLDALRGFVIVSMLWVNNLGTEEARYHQFGHADFGLFPTFTDMIFPWFLFMMGCAIPYARASRRAKGVSRGAFLFTVLNRAGMLFMLGCIVDASVGHDSAGHRLLGVGMPLMWMPAAFMLFLSLLIMLVQEIGTTKRDTSLEWYLSKFGAETFGAFFVTLALAGRIPIGMDVLQLLGTAYVVAALLYELPRKMYLTLAAFMLIDYWWFIRFFPAPTGMGVFEEGKTALDWLNNAYFSKIHLGGLESTIPAAVLVLIGTIAGETMRDKEVSPKSKIMRLLFGGIAFAIAGLLWHLDLPMSKHYWTPSYILFTAGLGGILLSLFYMLIDLSRMEKWVVPLVAVGMNPITAYFWSIMFREHVLKTVPLGKTTPWGGAIDGCVSTFGNIWGGWIFTALYICMVSAALWWMYRRKVFWRV